MALGVTNGSPVLGVELGITDGLLDGCVLGIELGVADGVLDGCLLGVELGVADGVPDGCVLGAVLGAELGCELGMHELSTTVIVCVNCLTSSMRGNPASHVRNNSYSLTRHSQFCEHNALQNMSSIVGSQS